MRFLLCMSLAGLSTFAVAQPSAPPAQPAWQHGGISTIIGTNAVTPRPRVLTPQEAALEEFAKPVTNTMATGSNTLGSIQRIYDITATTSNILDAASMLEVGRAQKVMDFADDLFRRGQVDLAFAAITNELGRVKQRAPRGILLSKLGAYHFRMQRFGLAAQCFDEARKNSPLDNGAICNYAACRLMLNEVDTAEGLLKSLNLSAIRDRKLLFSVFFNLGCIKSLQQNFNDSLDYLKRAAAADPAATLAALGDPQLDNVRLDVAFLALQQNLEQFIKQ